MTCFQPYSSLVKYVRVTPRMTGQREALEDRVEYRLGELKMAVVFYANTFPAKCSETIQLQYLTLQKG